MLGPCPHLKTGAVSASFAMLVTGFAATGAPQSAAQPIVDVADPAHPGDAAVAYPGTFPGEATRTAVGDGFRLANGTVITPANSTAGATTAVDIPAEPESIRLADRHAGKGVRTVYTYSEGSRSFEIIWTAILRDGGNHIQSTFEIGKVEGTFDVQSVDLFNAMLGGARIVGKDNGNPMAKQTVSGTNISFPIARSGDLKSGEVWNYSASIGASPEGQLRRGFLYYTEREKAHARRPFLHYQSWFDLKPDTPQDPASNTLVIQADEVLDVVLRFHLARRPRRLPRGCRRPARAVHQLPRLDRLHLQRGREPAVLHH